MIKKILLAVTITAVSATAFTQTIDYSLIPYRRGEKWGYASAQKNIVIAPKYDDAQWFSEGFAAVKMGSKWGYINKAGKMVIPAKFTVAKSFRKGYAPRAGKEGGDSILFAGASVQAGGYEKCINTKGIVLAKCPAINENAAAENKIPLEAITREKTYSVPNNNGLFDKITDDYKIAGSDETFYIAQKAGMYGVFNSKFETIVPFEYSSVSQLKSGGQQYLQVQKNGMTGVLKGTGAQDILPEYSSLKVINGMDNSSFVIVKKEGKTYVKDVTNGDVIANGYADINYDDNGGFVITGDSGLKGFYFMDKTVVAPKYTDVDLLNGGRYLKVKTFNGKTGYISAAGDEFFVE